LLVSHVVSMGVVILDLITLREIKVFNNVVDLLFLSPLHELGEHLLNIFEHELPSSAEPQEVIVVVKFKVSYLVFGNPLFNSNQARVLLRASVANKPSLLWNHFLFLSPAEHF